MTTRMISVLIAGALVAPLTAVLATPEPTTAQAFSTNPLIRQGEVLTYTVNSSRFGNIGTATMTVDSDTLEGRIVTRLSFDFSGRITLFKVSDHTRSWIDPVTGTTLRYSKSERSPLSKRDEIAIIDRSAKTWADAKKSYPLASNEPLDELAFIYAMRQLSSYGDALPVSLDISRHFDTARNPVRVNVLVPVSMVALGVTQRAQVLEMLVKDTRQKSGFSKLTFYLGEDAAHLPLRINSSMPVGGTMSLTLKSVTVVSTLARKK